MRKYDIRQTHDARGYQSDIIADDVQLVGDFFNFTIRGKLIAVVRAGDVAAITSKVVEE